MNKKLFIYTFATGRYTVYTDLWHFCIEHEYPEYRSMVFNTYRSLKNHNWPKYYGAVMRYLMEPPIEYLSGGFDYFYITDIDMFLIREEPTLFDAHLTRMNETGYCFSNARRGPGEPQGVNRVTGLHFGHKSWYDYTRDARDKYMWMLRDSEIGNISIDDELILAKIIKESGLHIPERADLKKWHHGIHLGTVRDRQKKPREERKSAFRIRVKRDKSIRWQEIVNTQEYRGIFNKINNYDRQAAWELREIDTFTKQMCNERK